MESKEPKRQRYFFIAEAGEAGLGYPLANSRRVSASYRKPRFAGTTGPRRARDTEGSGVAQF
jgi:hypothetical protein